MVQETSWEDRVEETCLQLTPPAVLASFDSWRCPEGSSEEHRRQAAIRVEIIRRWVEEEVPRLLQRLHGLLDERQSQSSEVGLTVKGAIAVACGVYISPRKKSDGSSASEVGREPWANARIKGLAIAILQHPLLSSDRNSSPSLTCLDSPLVTYLLAEYLKPIFSSSLSRNINAATGRAAHVNVNLAKGTEVMSGGALLDDEVMWKGGDAEKSAKMDILGRPALFDIPSGNDMLRRRHRALGCYNVLYICCDSLVTCQGDDLRDRWPLILPPLLAVLEDSAPLYRLIGSQIFITLLQAKHIGSILLQTGVATLLRQRLESNLTFISTDVSAALLQSSAEALLLLSQATTVGMYQGTAMPQNAVQDGGKERFSQLSRLMDEGVIRVWAYAPTTVALMDLEAEISSLKGSDLEASDVVNASIDVLTRLTKKDALGIGIARYLDLTLEFLAGQLIGLETRLGRRKGLTEMNLPLDREICSARAIEALLIVCKQAPGVLTWSSRCLDAAARCWVLLQDHREEVQVKALFAHLRGIVQALVDAHPSLMAQQLQKLIALDEDTFAVFVDPTM